MTSWAWTYTAGGLTLLDVAKHVRIEEEGGSYFADAGVTIPGRDGIQYDDEAPRAPLDLTLRTVLRYTDAAGAVTDPDGAAGHVLDNLSQLKQVFATPGLVTLTRTAPHLGTQRALAKLVGKPFTGEQRHIYRWPLSVPSGSWQAASESDDTGDPPTGVTVGGDTVVFDPRMSISAAGVTVVTLGDGTEYTITANAGPVYPVVVDVGAGTIVDDNGDDASGDVTFDHEHWFRLHPGETATLTTDNPVTVYWRARYS